MEIFLVYLLLGIGAGVMAGLFGVGGGVIIVPALIYTFTFQGLPAEVLTHMAVGTSLATIIFTSIKSISGHHKKGDILWYWVRWMTIGIVIGGILGSLTASFLSGPHLQLIFGIFLLAVGLQMLLSRQASAATELPVPPTKPWLGLSGGIVGWASTLFGIGGGTLLVPLFNWRKMPMQNAVGTSAACGFPIALVGALSFVVFGWGVAGTPDYSLGYVYFPALIGIVLTSFFAASLGVELAHKLSQSLLKKLFAGLLLLVGVDLIVKFFA